MQQFSSTTFVCLDGVIMFQYVVMPILHLTNNYIHVSEPQRKNSGVFIDQKLPSNWAEERGAGVLRTIPMEQDK